MKEKKTFFNTYEFDKAKTLAYYNLGEGLQAYQEYFRKYPEDYSAYAYYISLLIKVGRLNDAEEAIYYLEEAISKKEIFKRDPYKAKIAKYNLIYSKLKLLGYQKRYHDFLILYYNNYENISNIKSEVSFYFRKQIGDVDLTKREPNSYLFRQIVEYHENEFRDHIKKHLAEYNENDSNYSTTIFSPNFPIDEVINEVKKRIPNDKKLLLGFIDNTYIFKYDECGRDKNKLVDFFRVIVFDGTSDIITMCPTVGCENLPYIDLNFLKKDDDIKVKRLSQIDKFNMRYNRK